MIGGLLRSLFGPTHCTSCGDAFVESEYRDGFDGRTGRPIIRRWWHCPRSLDDRPDRWTDGTCRLAPWSCAVQLLEYRSHRPPRCPHDRSQGLLNDVARACWLGDRQITEGGRILVDPAELAHAS